MNRIAVSIASGVFLTLAINVAWSQKEEKPPTSGDATAREVKKGDLVTIELPGETFRKCMSELGLDTLRSSFDATARFPMPCRVLETDGQEDFYLDGRLIFNAINQPKGKEQRMITLSGKVKQKNLGQPFQEMPLNKPQSTSSDNKTLTLTLSKPEPEIPKPFNVHWTNVENLEIQCWSQTAKVVP